MSDIIKKCALCHCDATGTKFGFAVCGYHAEHGEDAPSCPVCQHPHRAPRVGEPHYE